jgi:hypothetical protein
MKLIDAVNRATTDPGFAIRARKVSLGFFAATPEDLAAMAPPSPRPMALTPGIPTIEAMAFTSGIPTIP